MTAPSRRYPIGGWSLHVGPGRQVFFNRTGTDVGVGLTWPRSVCVRPGFLHGTGPTGRRWFLIRAAHRAVGANWKVGGSMPERVRTAALVCLVLLAVGALVTALAGPARADVTRVRVPVVVVVDQPIESFKATVCTDRRGDDDLHRATLWLGSGNGWFDWSGEGKSVRRCVPIKARVYAETVTKWGAVDVQAWDEVGGEVETARTKLLRQSRLAVTRVENRGGGRVTVSVRLEHFSGDGYAGSNLSPVDIQELRSGRWVTRASVTTNRDGLAGATVATTGGMHTWRAVRKQGATVTGAVSETLRARVS